MTKTLQFGEKEVQFSTSFAWTFIYKSQFGKDPAQLLLPIIREMNESEDAVELGYIAYEKLGFVGIAEIAWAMAKLIDSDIPEPVKWIASFEEFPAGDLVDEIMPEAITSCFATKKSPAPVQEEKKPGPKKTTTKK